MGKEINKYIRKKADSLGLSQSDIAKNMARNHNDEKNYAKYKDIVNKWFTDRQEPGKEYLLDLSSILNVNVESILKAKDVDDDILNHPTLYLAAKTGDHQIIDRLFNEDNDIRVTTYDEYCKSFMDYVIEFKNYEALKYAMKQGYCDLEYINLHELLNNNEELKKLLLKLIINNDDLETWKKLFCRFDIISANRLMVYYKYIPEELCEDILKSQKILDFYITPSELTDEEMQYVDRGLVRDDFSLLHLKSLSPVYNSVMKKAIELKDSTLINKLGKIGLDYVKELNQSIVEERENLRITEEGELLYGHRTICAYVPYIKSSMDVSNYSIVKDIIEYERKTFKIK